MYQPSTIVGIPLNYSLFSSSQRIASCEASLACHLHPPPPQKKKSLKLVGVVNHVFDRRGSQLI